jgi:hypothetical protein
MEARENCSELIVVVDVFKGKNRKGGSHVLKFYSDLKKLNFTFQYAAKFAFKKLFTS